MLIKSYIPLDKSWIIRMGVLDLVNGYDDIGRFLDEQNDMGDDLLALKRAVRQWNSGKAIDVGESGTLYRFLQFASWKLGLNKEFVRHGTLKNRDITHDSYIVDYPIDKLLTLDRGTSQWASASVLLGGKRVPKKLQPYKLKLTCEALNHWRSRRKLGKKWLPRYDETIKRQAETFIKLLNNRKVLFYPKQSEDFCFGYVFGSISQKEAEKKWPSLRGHESDRILEMDEMFKKAKTGKVIDSKDHRVIQALVMWGAVNNKKIKIKYPKIVAKSWPLFWKFIKYFKKGLEVA